MVPFISRGKYFLKSLANFPVMKFPRKLVETFHFLQATQAFPEKSGVGEAELLWGPCKMTSSNAASHCSVDESHGHA